MDDGDDEEIESQEDVSLPTRGAASSSRASTNALGKGTRISQRQAAAAAAAAEKSQHIPSGGNNYQNNVNKSSDKVAETDRVWVQCSTCDKWRSLPSTVNPDTLPDIWTCDLNIYDSERNNCEAPEENYYSRDEEQQHVQLKSFLRLWVKKIKASDRAENRLASQSMTRGETKA